MTKKHNTPVNFSYGVFDVLDIYYQTPDPAPNAFLQIGDSIVFSQNGIPCMIAPQLAFGDTVICIANKALNAVPNYCVNVCGVAYVSIQGNMVCGGGTGSITNNGYPLVSFMDSLQRLLGQITLSSENMDIQDTYKISYNNGVLTVKPIFSADYSVSFYDIMGRCVVYAQGFDVLYLDAILPAGIYVCLSN
jgi:hypothetical protein